jgi:hypothetical protein
MDHSKITEKNNRIAEELKKKNDAKLKKAAKASTNVGAMSGNLSANAVRAASTMTGSILIKQGVDQNLTNSIINNRDTKMNYRDAQYLNPDSRLYSQVKYEGRFRKRTFRTADRPSILFDEVRLKLQEECGNCKGQLLGP